MTEQRIREERLEKAIHFRAIGQNPYDNTFKPSDCLEAFAKQYESFSREELAEAGRRHQLSGRIMAIRSLGKASFYRIQDSSGHMQLFFQKESLGEAYEQLRWLDMGDFIGVEGFAMRTKTGELSLQVTRFQILTKSLRPLPEKWHGLSNVEQRYRQRYLDLIVNEHTRQIFQTRSKVIRKIQSFLDAQGFMEVETPILSDVAGGAAARPFMTHHNALNEDLSLRIATELHLKRLLVGGFERVYEIGRLFRNEGVSTTHNPEFTTIEFYQAYATYQDFMDLTEKLFRELALLVSEEAKIFWGEHEIDFKKPFRRVSIARLVGEHIGLSEQKVQELEQTKDVSWALQIAEGRCVTPNAPQKILEEHGMIGEDPVQNRNLALHLLYAVFEHEIEKTLIQPTFLLDFPVAVSPLARRRDSDAAVVDRFELFIGGMELANSFSELNDPVDQRERFEAQLRQRHAGNDEAHDMDEDFLTALEIGMPPAAGQGIGIDRLVMLLTNSASIREVVLFPKMRAR
ncbi:MAG: lysine--tRNA ligase [Myxococcaceae bacterium]|nr:lysine--tRNA ligase [Myxococcaceae bacterium]MBH2006774.1 lysine--tRNA ligase [Myxococcaceae bacterium]